MQIWDMCQNVVCNDEIGGASTLVNKRPRLPEAKETDLRGYTRCYGYFGNVSGRLNAKASYPGRYKIPQKVTVVGGHLYYEIALAQFKATL